MGYPAGRRKPAPNVVQQAERLEALVADRGASRDANRDDQIAVTRGDFAELGEVVLQSVYVSAAPTAAEHNALIDDLRAVAALANKLGAKFKWTA